MNLGIYCISTNRATDQVFERCKEAFRSRGVEISIFFDRPPLKSDGMDVLLCRQDLVDKNTLELGLPILMNHKKDSCLIEAHNHERLRHSSVLRWYKHATFKPAYLTGEFAIDPMLNYVPDVAVMRENSSKIKPGVSFGMANHMAAWISPVPSIPIADRDIDVLCLVFGHPKPDRNPHPLLLHRQQAIRSLKNISGLRSVYQLLNEKLPMEEYRVLALNSKIILSPWGYGETCYRDYDAWFAQNILIKPYTGYVDVTGDSYRSEDTVFWCNSDFSDLEQVVQFALKTSKLENRERICREVLHWWQPDAIADYFANDWKELGLL